MTESSSDPSREEDDIVRNDTVDFDDAVHPLDSGDEKEESSHSKSPESTPELADVTIAWQGACEEGTLATQTIKAGHGTETVQPLSLNVAIKERSIRAKGEITSSNEPDTDDYDLLKVIGKGGMGVVFSARQASVDRIVAVKMLRSAHDSTPRKELFLQEAIVTADLDHPNIVPIHELGSDADGSLFYSMKEVQGEAWHRVIRKTSLEQNINILMRVADAIAFAHARGIVHRDVKPENVMLGQYGEVWLMDWGLALPTDRYTKPTVKPQMGGTPAYMPPEMAIPNREVGPLSDVYLLGATLFEIVTRRPPHAGSSTLNCLRAAASNRIVSTDKTGGLMDIAYHAMATDPNERPQSVTEFQDAVRQWMSHSESLAITKNAQELLSRARESRQYEDFVRAIFGLEQAIELFPGNVLANKELINARYRYAELASENGDYDLATSQLDANVIDHQRLLRSIQMAKENQLARKHRLKQQQIALRCLLVITCGLLIGGIWFASRLRSSALELANTNDPAMHASMSLQSGMRRSLGSLRGWVALGDPTFKEDRQDAWNSEIWPAVEALRSVTTDSIDTPGADRLASLNRVLDDLYEEQWWIEDVAQTPGNEPATDLLLRDIEPVEVEISRAMETLLSLEQQKELSENEDTVWPTLTELQLTFAKTHRSLIGVIDNGDEIELQTMQNELMLTDTTLTRLKDEPSSLNQEQKGVIEWVASEFAAYERLAQQAVTERASEQSNVAQWRLRTQAIPTAKNAEEIIGEIVDSYRAATVSNSDRINRISTLVITFGIALFVGVALATILTVVRRLTRRSRQMIATMLTTVILSQSSSALFGQEAVESADVFVQVSLIIDDLELIRREMGKPKCQSNPITVHNAGPHEVYFQALTLFQKTDELCFEQIRQRKTKPEKPINEIQRSDVLEVVQLVGDMLKELKENLNISENAQPPERDPSVRPTDVFTAILKANQQLNLLVERRFTPSNVYQQVTLAVSYGSTLLGAFPDSTRLPNEPEFEPRKTPSDVYRRLLDCLTRIRSISEQSGTRMLRLDIPDDAIETASPSDVYDIASLLVSELAHLHALHGKLKTPRRVFYPGRVFPSHVFQRAGMLEKQIERLENLVREDPDWLNE